MSGVRLRHVVAAAVAVVAVGTVPAVLASNVVPTSTIGYQEVVVSGSHLSGITYTLAGTTVTGFTATLTGNLTLPLRSVSAAWTGEASRSCTVGLYDIVSGTTPATCTGYTHNGQLSATLTITVV